MQPMLDDLALPQVQEIGTYDVRTLAEHKPPGADGSHLQNLGRRPTRIALWGVATGPDTATVVEDLEAQFRSGSPMAFTADITADSAIEKVVIDDLQLQDVAGVPERTAYVVTLRQFIEPHAPEDTTSVDLGVLDDAASLMDDLVGALAIAQAFGTGLEQFVGTLSQFVERLGTPP
jgi:prophage DNA circulation protein